MRTTRLTLALGVTLVMGLSTTAIRAQQDTPAEDDDVRTLVSRLSLEQYKTTLEGLTQFGDRRQGTQRNRDAIDWIEAQLQAVGCTTTERIDYVHDPQPRERRGRRGTTELNPDSGTPTAGQRHAHRWANRPQWQRPRRQLDLRLPAPDPCQQ